MNWHRKIFVFCLCFVGLSVESHPQDFFTICDMGGDCHSQQPYLLSIEHTVMLSVSNSDPILLERAIAVGAEVNFFTPDGLSPLHVASRHGNIDSVRILVESGADVNIEHLRIGHIPLMYAVMYADTPNHIDVVEYLIDQGADVNAINWSSPRYTPLSFALTKACRMPERRFLSTDEVQMYGVLAEIIDILVQAQGTTMGLSVSC